MPTHIDIISLLGLSSEPQATALTEPTTVDPPVSEESAFFHEFHCWFAQLIEAILNMTSLNKSAAPIDLALIFSDDPVNLGPRWQALYLKCDQSQLILLQTLTPLLKAFFLAVHQQLCSDIAQDKRATLQVDSDLAARIAKSRTEEARIAATQSPRTRRTTKLHHKEKRRMMRQESGSKVATMQDNHFKLLRPRMLMTQLIALAEKLARISQQSSNTPISQQLLLFAQLCLDIYELLYDIAETQCCEGQELFEASDLQQHEHVRLTVKCYLIFSLLEDFLKKNQFQPIPSLVAHLDDVLCEYRESAQQCLEPQSLVANFIAHATAYKIEFYTTIIKRKQDAEPHLVAQLSTGCEVTEPEQQSAYLQATWHFMVAQSMMAEERPDQAMDSALRALAFCCMIQNDNLLEIPGVIVLQRELTQSQKLYYQILQWINHTVMPSLENHSSCEQQQQQLLEIKARWRPPRLGRPPRPGRRRGGVSSVFCGVESEEDDQDPGYYTGTQPSPSGVEPDTVKQHVFNS